MRKLLVLAVAVATTAPMEAQVAALPDDSPEIVVERKLDRKKEIADYVDALTRTTNNEPMGRFEAAICPGVIGLPDEQNRLIANRLREVAQAIGLAVAGEQCAANAIVVLTDDKDAFVKVLRAKYPALFTDALGKAINIPAENGSAIAWHVAAMVDANGIPAQVVRNTDGTKHYSVQTYDGWRLTPGLRPQFAAGVVVIDIRVAAGLTTTQLADYAAMRIFGKTKPDRLDASASSILRALDAPADSQVPLTMTATDLAFLKSLYSMNPLRYSGSQRARMKHDINKQLSGKR